MWAIALFVVLDYGISFAVAQGNICNEVGEKFRDCSSCPEMIVVPAGDFLMGSSPSEADRGDDEGPQRRVTIADPFAVGIYEIKRSEFAAYVKATGYSAEKNSICTSWTGQEWSYDVGPTWQNPLYYQRADHPVVCVNWDEVHDYIRWLSQQTGEQYYLLSEAEWEYVARAGSTTRYFFGDTEEGICDNTNGVDQTAKANSNTERVPPATCRDGYVYSAPVGSFEPNAFGLYDVLGNAWEWMEDCRHINYEGAPFDGSAWTVEGEGGDCAARSRRGGSWNSTPNFLRIANRLRSTTDKRFVDNGFRVARAL